MRTNEKRWISNARAPTGGVIGGDGTVDTAPVGPELQDQFFPLTGRVTVVAVLPQGETFFGWENYPDP